MALSPVKLKKAAEILMCLGQQTAKEVLAYLPEEDARAILPHLMQQPPISQESRGVLLDELRTRYTHHDLRELSGPIAKLDSGRPARSTGEPFETLRDVDANRLLEVVANEPPNIIVLLLYYLPRDKAAAVLSGLTDAVRSEAVMRLANLRTPTPLMVSRLEHLITQKLSDASDDPESSEREIEEVTGARTLVEILGLANPSVERRVYEFLQEKDPALAEDVRKQMFVFEDIVHLDARSLQIVLRELTAQELALSLKGATPQLRDSILSNVSDNFGKAIQEEFDLLGPVRLSTVEEAQQSLAAAVRRLVEEGTITIRRNDDDDVLV